MQGYVKVSLVYLVAALLWVGGSDWLFLNIFPGNFEFLVLMKGIGFALVTAGLLYLLLRRDALRRGRVEAELQAILDNMTDFYYRADQRGLLLSVSRQIESLLGYRLDEVIGRPITMLYETPSDRQILLRTLNDQQGAVVDFELRMRHRDGQGCWVSVSSHILRDRAGVMTGVEGMVRLIEERKQASVAIQEARTLVQALLNTSPDATMLMDLKGILLAVNSVMALRFSVAPEELLGRCLWDLFPEKIAALRQNALAEVLRVGGPLVFRDSREGRFYENSFYPVCDVNGVVDKLAVFSRDITAQRQAEEEVKEREELYRAIFENMPVVKLRTDPDSGAIIDANKAAAAFYGWSQERLRAMRMLDINLWAPDRTSFDMDQVRQGKSSSFQARHRLASGAIRDVEVHSGPIRVRGKTFLHSIIIDVTERRRAERNLNDARLQAEAAAREKSQFVAKMSHELRTPMNGILGITRLLRDSELSAEQKDWVENIGHCNAELMGILEELMVFSRGGGMDEAAGEADLFVTTPKGSIQQLEQLPLPLPLPAMKILLAEDNFISQKITQTLLTRRGHTVAVVSDGAEAVRAATTDHYDLILMDVQMPGKDGLWAAQSLRELGHSTPILALTAQAMPEDAQRCLDAGMDGYITKPFTAEQLVGGIVRLLASRWTVG